MAKRQRRQTPRGDFQDPLKNYESPEYADELERALMEDDVTAIPITPISTVMPEATVEDAMRLMAKYGIACVLVVEGNRLLGLFSERDVLNKVAERFDEVRHRSVTTVMTADPLVVHDIDSPATALNLMAVQGFRHVPILSVDEKLVGIVGPRRITTYLQQQMEAA